MSGRFRMIPMTCPTFDKWLTGVGPGDRVAAVARRAVCDRLAAVAHFLPRAARPSRRDPEDVHQLRVGARRAGAALALFADWLPRRRAARMAKWLRRIRRAANAARDADVLIARLAARPADPATRLWLRLVRAGRRQAQAAVVDAHERYTATGRLARHADRLVDCVRPPKRSMRKLAFGVWAPGRLHDFAAAFAAALPPAGADADALHRFRIRGKELRYALELLAAGLPAGIVDRVYPEIERLQERLGRLNDRAAAVRNLEQALADARTDADRELLATCLTRERRQFLRTTRDAGRDMASGRLAQLVAVLDGPEMCEGGGEKKEPRGKSRGVRE
jgi:CHAD domain-containing protein